MLECSLKESSSLGVFFEGQVGEHSENKMEAKVLGEDLCGHSDSNSPRKCRQSNLRAKVLFFNFLLLTKDIPSLGRWAVMSQALRKNWLRLGCSFGPRMD